MHGPTIPTNMLSSGRCLASSSERRPEAGRSGRTRHRFENEQPDTSDRRPRAASPGASPASELGAILCANGACAALAYLNARTRFRFTGVYRADGPAMRGQWLFDRENPTLTLSADAYASDVTRGTLAQFGRATALGGTTAPLRRHTTDDDSAVAISYVGLLLCTALPGRWAVLCHFDFRPRLLSANERAIFEGGARVLNAWLRTHE